MIKTDLTRMRCRQAMALNLFKKLETRIYGKYNNNHADIDAGAFADDKDYRYKYRNLQTGTSINYTFAKSTIRFNYNYNWYQRDYTDDSASVGGFAKYQKGEYTSKSHFAEVYGNFTLNKNIELLAGVDYRHNATDQILFINKFFWTISKFAFVGRIASKQTR